MIHASLGPGVVGRRVGGSLGGWTPRAVVETEGRVGPDTAGVRGGLFINFTRN